METWMWVLLGQIVLGFVIIVGITGIFGAVAPRVPNERFSHDGWLGRVRPWETPRRYRRIGAQWLVGVMPDAGETMGGTTKSRLPEAADGGVDRYLIEVRRAEWVHTWSMISWIPLWPIALVWPSFTVSAIVNTAIAILVNLPFMIVVRYNHVRIDVLQRRRQRQAP